MPVESASIDLSAVANKSDARDPSDDPTGDRENLCEAVFPADGGKDQRESVHLVSRQAGRHVGCVGRHELRAIRVGDGQQAAHLQGSIARNACGICPGSNRRGNQRRNQQDRKRIRREAMHGLP